MNSNINFFSKILKVQSTVFVLFLILVSCQKNIETALSSEQKSDQTNNWIVLDKGVAIKKGSTYSWNFNVKHPVKYVVQIVLNNGVSVDKNSVQDRKSVV